ncbi:hypothetical protein [Flavobacterium sp.]|jgi:hypothetical protein|uniref:hypothetical protein n=1 Tax=Flavobacterium sp. TaxID=239 RepID=UPI0037C1135F
MAQHQIDNQIKSKLNTREIQPSAQAWDRLDAMLTVSENKKSKKSYGWFFVAASLVLFFGLGFFIFNQNEEAKINLSTPVLTSVDEDIDSIKSNKTGIIPTEKTTPILVQNEVNYLKALSNNKSEGSKELVKGENVADEKIAPNSQLPIPNIQLPTPEKLLVEVSVNQKEIPLIKKNKTNSKIKIDAASLLSTVEKELDENYKETTLDKLSRKFQDAKSALANRNYE